MTWRVCRSTSAIGPHIERAHSAPPSATCGSCIAQPFECGGGVDGLALKRCGQREYEKHRTLTVRRLSYIVKYADDPALPTGAELEILRVLWANGPSSVRDVHEIVGGGTSYTTTLKLLQMMHAKRLAARRCAAPAHLCGGDRDGRTLDSLVSRFVDSVFDGSAGALALRALGDGSASRDELAQLKNSSSSSRRTHDALRRRAAALVRTASGVAGRARGDIVRVVAARDEAGAERPVSCRQSRVFACWRRHSSSTPLRHTSPCSAMRDLAGMERSSVKLPTRRGVRPIFREPDAADDLWAIGVGTHAVRFAIGSWQLAQLRGNRRPRRPISRSESQRSRERWVSIRRRYSYHTRELAHSS